MLGRLGTDQASPNFAFRLRWYRRLLCPPQRERSISTTPRLRPKVAPGGSLRLFGRPPDFVWPSQIREARGQTRCRRA